MKAYQIEEVIVHSLVDHCLAAGYSLSVDDGGDNLALEKSTSREEILDALMNTSQDTVLVYDSQGKKLGFVDLVYGNEGWSVMSDWSMSINTFLEPIHTLSEKYQEEE